MQLEIRLLGQFEVKFAGSMIQIPSRPAQSLLAYLSLNAGIAHRRERLAGLFWSEASDAHSRGYLRSALWHLRKSFESISAPWQKYLLINEISVTFQQIPDTWLDVQQVICYKDPQDWSTEELIEAVSSYRGELLPGFYEEWILPERERIQACYNQKMKILLQQLIRESRWEAVLEWGERWIAQGHVPEPAYRALLIAYTAMDDQTRLKFTYQRYTETLEKELDVPVSGEMNELYTQLVSGKITAELLPSLNRNGKEDFLQHQLEETAQKLADTEQKQQEEQEQAALRDRHLLQVFTSIGVVLVILAVIVATVLQRSATQAAFNRSMNLAIEAREVNLAGQNDLALALALEAVKIHQPPAETLLALRRIASSPGTRAVLKGHSQAAKSVALSPDHKSAVSGSCAQREEQETCLVGELVLWDITSGKAERKWSAHQGWVNAVIFSMNGQRFVSGSSDGTIIIWDTNTGMQLYLLDGKAGGITSLAVSSMDNLLLSGTQNGSLELWDLNTGRLVRRFLDYSSPVTSMAMSSKSSLAVVGYSDGVLILWDDHNTQPLRYFQSLGSRVNAVTISPDDSWFLTTSSNALRQIDSQSGKVLTIEEVGEMLGTMVLAPSGTYVLVSQVGSLIQWDLIHWEEQNRFTSLASMINSITISQDGSLALAAMNDGSLHEWNLLPSVNYVTINTGIEKTDAIAASPNGKYLFLGGLSSSTQKLVAWEIDKQKVVKTYPSFRGQIPADGVRISPDGRYLAAAGGLDEEGKPDLMVWKLASGEIQCTLQGFKIPVRSLAFSPDSRWLLTGSQSDQNELILWDLGACTLIRRFQLKESEDAASIVFSRDGKKAITGTASLNRVILWDVATGQEIQRFTGPGYPDTAPVLGVAFGPDGNTLLVTGIGRIYLWDMITQKITRQYMGFSGLVLALAVSPNGKYVVGGSADGEVILWDVLTGEELDRYSNQKQVYNVTFSPDSQYTYSISPDGMLVQMAINVKSLPELLDWIKLNRYVRELTCEERTQYHVEPLCK